MSRMLDKTSSSRVTRSLGSRCSAIRGNILLDPGNPKEKEYYEAFGRFVSSYARAESMVHSLARHFSGTTDAKARVIFGGLSVCTEKSIQLGIG